jgi:uncharacterized membrane protein YccC
MSRDTINTVISVILFFALLFFVTQDIQRFYGAIALGTFLAIGELMKKWAGKA